MKNTFFFWIYGLGVNIMLVGYNRMSNEERRETWIHKYVNGSSWTEDKNKQLAKDIAVSFEKILNSKRNHNEKIH